MKIVIVAEGDKAKTEMVGEGHAKEVQELIFQMDRLRFKLLRMLDDEGEGSAMVYQRKDDTSGWGDEADL